MTIKEKITYQKEWIKYLKYINNKNTKEVHNFFKVAVNLDPELLLLALETLEKGVESNGIQ